MMKDYVLSWIENGQQQQVYFRVSLPVALGFANSLPADSQEVKLNEIKQVQDSVAVIR